MDGWSTRLLVAMVWTVAGAGCNAAANACEDFIDAVEECQGGPDDHWNQSWCDEAVERGCEDRRYYNCLESNLECVDGQASTAPIFCNINAEITCPD